VRELRYVGGGSSTFWRIERTGSVGTVWFGPLGGDGQSRVKDLGRDDAGSPTSNVSSPRN
jgi:hypothetical protein